jgi:hypothetical protein
VSPFLTKIPLDSSSFVRTKNNAFRIFDKKLGRSWGIEALIYLLPSGRGCRLKLGRCRVLVGLLCEEFRVGTWAGWMGWMVCYIHVSCS